MTHFWKLLIASLITGKAFGLAPLDSHLESAGHSLLRRESSSQQIIDDLAESRDEMKAQVDLENLFQWPEVAPRSSNSCGYFKWTDKTFAGTKGAPGVCGQKPSVCKGSGTAEDAAAYCEELGARLCSKTEMALHEAAGHGCDYDNRYVWTSTKCGEDGQGFFAAKVETTKCVNATGGSAHFGRCCADAEVTYTEYTQDYMCGEVENALWHEGGDTKEGRHAGEENCKQACTEDPSCQYYLWKDEPGTMWRYHCAGYGIECKLKDYDDGATAKLYKKDTDACARLTDTSWTGDGKDMTTFKQDGCIVVATNPTKSWSPATGTIMKNVLKIMNTTAKVSIFADVIEYADGNNWTKRTCADMSGSWGQPGGTDVAEVRQTGCAVKAVNPSRGWSPAFGHVVGTKIKLFGETGKFERSAWGDTLTFAEGVQWKRKSCAQVGGEWKLEFAGDVTTITQDGCSIKAVNPARQWSPASGTVSETTITMFGITAQFQGTRLVFSNGATFKRSR